jgi:hypothetical protein
MEAKPINAQVHFRSGVEPLPLTSLGDGLYRLELSRLFASHPTMGDIIECESLPDGALKFRRIVKSADFQRLEFVVDREVAESERLAIFLDTVIGMGGNWERNFGGWLVLFLPPSASRNAVAARFNRDVLAVQVKTPG